jgi:hypothetical protein
MGAFVRALRPALLLLLGLTAPTSSFAGEVLAEFDIGKDAAAVIIPVTIRGRSYPFLVDTGSTYSVFDTSLRPLLGEKAEGKNLSTPNGAARFEFTMPPAAFVGSLPLAKDRPVMVLDLKPTSEALGLEIKGCLGMDFLSQYVVRIDFDQGRLALSRTPGRDAGQAVPLQIGGGRAFVEANVFGTGPANSFLIDTGDIGLGSGRLTGSTFRLLNELGKLSRDGVSKVETGGGRMEVKQGFVESLTIGAFEHRRLNFGDARDADSLGLGFWARYTPTFDFPGKVVYMKASERHRVTDTPAASGLGLVKREGRVIVEGIQEGSPAAKAGIVKGDEVLSIDDRKAGECAIIVLGRLLRGEGRTVRIEVRHGEVVREVAVRLDLAWRTAKQGP